MRQLHLDNCVVHALGAMWRPGSVVHIPAMISEAEATILVERGEASWVDDLPTAKPIAQPEPPQAPAHAIAQPVRQPQLQHGKQHGRR